MRLARLRLRLSRLLFPAVHRELDDALRRETSLRADVFLLRAEPTPDDAQRRLAEVEQALADFHRSRGLAPSGAVVDQVRQMALDLGRALDRSLSDDVPPGTPVEQVVFRDREVSVDGTTYREAYMSTERVWPPVRVLYRNHRDEIAWRTLRPLRFWYGRSRYHEHPGYMVTAVDVERQECGRDDHTREFSMDGVLAWALPDGVSIRLVLVDDRGCVDIRRGA